MDNLKERLKQAKIDRDGINKNIEELEKQIKESSKTYKPGDTISSTYEKAKIFRLGSYEVVLVNPDDNYCFCGKSFKPVDIYSITRKELDSWGFNCYK